jgi:hAT family C-terminal dimerisation region
MNLTREDEEYLRANLGVPPAARDDDAMDIDGAHNPFASLNEFRDLARDVRAIPLEWLRENDETYTVVAACARDVLSIPASSATVERLFSVAGNVLSDLRLSLKDSLSCAILFLHYNRRWFYPWKGKGGLDMPPYIETIKSFYRQLQDQ